MEKLNKITFSDAEWERFFAHRIAGANDSIIEKTARIQEDHIQVLTRDDGSSRNVYLIDKQNIHNNVLQVINQYEADGRRATRYDVTILVNGLPMVHVEIKRPGVDIREAFNQIDRCQRDSFWSGSGLFEYVQLFVISNGTLTKYYSNTVRDGHLAELRGKRGRRHTSNSFAFTSWWADAKKRPITDLVHFTKTFFARHTLLNILTRYCVFDVDRKLLEGSHRAVRRFGFDNSQGGRGVGCVRGCAEGRGTGSNHRGRRAGRHGDTELYRQCLP